MRIARIELDGFGRFSQASWELPPGLSVFLGNNEAGKTTLLNAIRALLFRFESSRRDRAWYPAFAGGRRGGRLQIEMARGDRWTIERHGDRGGTGSLEVRAPNGNIGGQETLDRLLGGATRDVFNNVFAFGLGELQSFESLSAEGVRGRIYGASAGLGGTSAMEVERRLREMQEESFKSRGQKGINELLSQIEERRKRIGELEQLPAQYDHDRRRLGELEEEIRALEAERTRQIEERGRLVRIERARPILAELSTAETELAAGDPRDEAVSPDAIERWERRRDAVDAARRALADTDQAVARTCRRLESLAVDEELVHESGEIEALRADRQLHERRAADRPVAEATAARHAAEVDEHVRRLGPGWDERRLLAVDDSLVTIQLVAEHEQRLNEARGALEAAQRRLEAVESELEGQEAAVAPHGSPVLLDAGEARTRSVALADLADILGRMAVLDERLRSLRERRADLSGRGAADVRARRPLLPAWPAAALATAAVMSAVAGALTSAPGVGAIGAAVAAALAALYLLGRNFLARDAGADGAISPDKRGDEAARLDRDIDAGERDRTDLVSRARALEDRAALRTESTLAEVRAATEQLAEERARLAERRGADARIAALRERREARAADVASAAVALDQAHSAWSGRLAELALDGRLSPDGARQVLAAATAARRAAGHRDAAQAALRREDEELRESDARLDALLRRLEREVPSRRDVRTAAFAALLADLERSLANRSARAEVEAELENLTERRRSQIAELEGRERSLADWLATCGVADEDELRTRTASAARRREWRRIEREAHEKLRVLVGSERAVEEVRAENERLDPAALEAAQVDIGGRIEAVTSRIGDLQREHGAIQARLRELESSEELGRLRQEVAVLEATAAEEARRWSVRAIALALLEETRARHERERQPQVVRDAERYFSLITDGRYTRILAAPGESWVRVEEGDGLRRKEIDELSRGTAEQLYLALRFGLIEQFARAAEPLPVVMDDILVNFDEERGARAAEAIRQLGRSHQVIYFTCHRPIAQLLDRDGERTTSLA